MDEYLKQQLAEINEVLNLKHHSAWHTIMRDAQVNFDSISHSWFEYEEGSKELAMLRARQIANKTILSLMDLYESRFEQLSQEVIAKEDPSIIQSTEVDNNIQEEDTDE